VVRPFADVDRPAGETYFAPTIVCSGDPGHEIVQKETFGPVLVVQRAKNWDDALLLCNGVRQGLAAALFSSSQERVTDFLRGARAGILKINSATSGAAADLPFGGWKSSGVGPAEHGASNREFFTRAQSIYFS
jgi:acyl-CoA reductase-like NAD-dependent aldehyde dehydrogenase